MHPPPLPPPLRPSFHLYPLQVTAFKSNGATSPTSAPDTVTTSPLAAPTSLGGSVHADSPTTATATAVPPPGITYTSYTFTAVPLNGGGPPVTVTGSSPTAAFSGLAPGTQASARGSHWLPWLACLLSRAVMPADLGIHLCCAQDEHAC